MRSQGSQALNLAPLLAILLGLIVVFHLGNALGGRFLYRAQHLGAALEYAHGRIDLLRPVIVGFNANGTPTPQELPIWQATAGLVFKLTRSTWHGWANVVSLLFFAAGLWPFYQLARQYVGDRAAGWALAFFLAQPLIIVYMGKAATDGFCLVLTIWFVFFADRMIRSGQARWWPFLAAFACLGAISKLPFFMAAGLCSIALLVVNQVRSWQPWVMLIGAGAVGAVAFVAWTHFCDSLSAQAEYPYQDLRLSHNPFMVWWYFGDLQMRVDPRAWIKPGWRLLHGTLGSLPLTALLLAGLFGPGNRLAKLWLLAAVLVTLVFTNVVQIHWHYYLMFSPGVALLCGATVARRENLWTERRQWLKLALAAVVLVFSAVDGLTAMKLTIDYDPFPQQVSALLRQYTRPQDKLIVYKCDPEWPGEVLFRSERKGLYLPTLEASPHGSTNKGLYALLNSETDLRRLKALGYNKLVLISESPVTFAAQAVNPGFRRKRFYYPATISPKVDAWPVVYRSEDMLIKDIPFAAASAKPASAPDHARRKAESS
jgi:hypothetical protein